MTTFAWKILEIKSKDDLITEAKYYVLAKDESNSVDTEGFFRFGKPELKKPFDQVSEDDVVAWIKDETMQNGSSSIESRLQEQLDNIENKSVLPPWVPQVFTPNLG